MSFLKTLEEYFKKNWKYIAIVVGALFLITAIIAIRGIEFKRNPNKQLEKIILYEKFSGKEGLTSGMEVVLEDGFCDRPADVLEQKCRDLQEKSCKNSNCCIWGRPNTELEDPGNDPITNPEGCYHGDETGAKFNNSQLNLDYWYYKGKDRDSAERFPKAKIPEIEPMKPIEPEGKEGAKNMEGKKKTEKDPKIEAEKPKIEAEKKKDLEAARDKLAERFKEDPIVPPANKESIKSATRAAELEEKKEAEREHAAETQEQKFMRRQSAEEQTRRMKHYEELARVRLNHAIEDKWADLKQRQAAAEEISRMEKKDVQQLQIDAAKDNLEKAERAADKHTVQRMVDEVVANNTGEGAAPTDLAEIASKKVEEDRAKADAQKSLINLENKERELAKIANPPVVQGEKPDGTKISQNSRAKELAAALTPQSVAGVGGLGAAAGGVKARIAALNGIGGKVSGVNLAALRGKVGGLGGAKKMWSKGAAWGKAAGFFK